jgi:hypothetical protein
VELDCAHGVEGYVGDSRCHGPDLFHGHHHGYGLANLYHSHNLVLHDGVKLGNYEHPMCGEETMVESDVGNDLAEILLPHDSHCDHVILLILHPSHSDHSENFDYDSEQGTVTEEEFHLHPLEVLDYPSQL